MRVSRARRLYLATLIKRYVDYIERGQKLGVFRAFDAELFVFYTLGAITFQRGRADHRPHAEW